MKKNDNNGTLILMVERGNEINIEYSRKEIINKINSYFGYKLINEIRLKTFNLTKKKGKEKNILNITSEKFQDTISKINNKNIRDSLSQLIDVAKK